MDASSNARPALEVGLRLANLIDTGSRESTYKLATLLALCQLCTEQFPDDTGSGLSVSILDLADRVIALYWRQREPFSLQSEAPLRQVKDGAPTILARIDDLRARTARVYGTPNLWRAKTMAEYPTYRQRIAQVIAQMPLTHLQRSDHGRTHDAFLYDDRSLNKKINRRELDSINWSIQLRPGIASALAQVAPLLTPLIESAWITEARRFNADLCPETAVEKHLFGLDRSNLRNLRGPLIEMQRNRCFYCDATMTAVHIDHVLPWSRTGLDDLSNLVAADGRCNLSKSGSLPSARWIVAAVEREHLNAVGGDLTWPLDRNRTR